MLSGATTIRSTTHSYSVMQNRIPRTHSPSSSHSLTHFNTTHPSVSDARRRLRVSLWFRCTESVIQNRILPHPRLRAHSSQHNSTLWRIRCVSATARVFEVQVYGVEQQDSYIQSDGTNSSYVPTPAETLPNVALGRGNYSLADSVSTPGTHSDRVSVMMRHPLCNLTIHLSIFNII
jgi:hypothetical protein